MNTENVPDYIESSHYQAFKAGLGKIASQVEHADNFHLALYYASLVSMMEKYLFDVFITEIEGNDSAFLRMCKMDKYANQTFKLSQILHGNIRQHVITSVKSMVWHRLNDVDLFYKKVFNFKLNISKALIKRIGVRHDIVHRNGFNLAGDAIHLDREVLTGAITNFGQFISDIDKKYSIYRASLPHSE